MVRLSIILISWNSFSTLRRCLAALKPVVSRSDTELVWVDNGSTDGAWEYMAAEWPAARRFRLDRNYGVAAGRNRGLCEAKGEYLIFLDDDTEASPEAVDALVGWLESHQQCGIAACSLRDGEGRLQESFKPYPGLRAKICNVVRAKLGRGEEEPTLPQGVIHPCYVIGACQAFRRTLVDEIGFLDDAIFYGPEDADFCIRARKAGYTVDYLPQISITHHWRRITTKRVLSASGRRHIAGLIHFWRKNRRL